MKYSFISPTEICLQGTDAEVAALATELTYEDAKVVQEIRRLKHNPWFVNRYGEEAYREKLDDLKARQKVCLVKHRDGEARTLAGFYGRLEAKGVGRAGDGIQAPAPEAWGYK